MGNIETFWLKRAVGELQADLGIDLFAGTLAGPRVAMWDCLPPGRMDGLQAGVRDGLRNQPRGGATWEKS